MRDTVAEARAVAPPRHPLDPLTPDEIRRAAATVRAVHDREAGMVFETISLHEPDKRWPGAALPTLKRFRSPPGQRAITGCRTRKAAGSREDRDAVRTLEAHPEPRSALTAWSTMRSARVCSGPTVQYLRRLASLVG
jgi:hypothetical protein